MTNLKKASIASILVLLLIIGITLASFAENLGTITKEAKLRKTTSNDSTVLEIIPNNEEVEILEEDEEWYKVRYNRIRGYVLKDYIKVKEQNTENSNVEEIKQQEITKGAVIKTNAQTNLYIRPLINSTVIGTIEKGKNIAIIEIVNEWAYVNIDANNGWVRIEELKNTETTKNEQTTALNKTGYISVTAVNLRQKPEAEAKILDVLEQNAKVVILEEQGDWYKISSNNQTGYIKKNYISEKKVETTSRGSINRTKTTTTTTAKTETTTKTTTASTTEKTVSNASTKGQEVANYTKQFIGCKYVYGGSSTKGFDCSGLTMYVYKKFGVNLVHSSSAQSKAGKTVSRANLQPGDLVFFKNSTNSKGIGHVGIYVGNNKFVHAATPKSGVITSSLSGSYSSTYVTAVRIF